MKIPMAIPKQLTRLQFYGLALSAFWVVAVAFYERQAEMPKAQQYAMAAYYTCAERNAAQGNRDINACLANVSKDWDDWMNHKWGDIATIALVPLAAAWLAGFTGILIYRWNKERMKV